VVSLLGDDVPKAVAGLVVIGGLANIRVWKKLGEDISNIRDIFVVENSARPNKRYTIDDGD
jgi:hypothetical protein